MSNVFTTAGATLGVSASAPATYDQAGFAALTFTTVAEITDFGEFGKQYELVTHNPVGDRRTVKRKGTYNDGALALQLGRDPSDAGQTLLIAARDSDASYSFKITLQDGTIMYFSAQTLSYTTNLGSANNIVSAAAQLEIDNDIIEV